MPSVELSKMPGVGAARAVAASDRAQIEARARPAASGAASRSAGAAPGISVELTGGTEIAGPPVDADRVSQIRAALRDGSYPLVPTKIVDAMIAAQVGPAVLERS
ncbi:flagellar biosynthesis anti-sigma factor FlgM [Porphyrobacter sp. TH134]|uniref:flagellar biosynthesis anti-sigma factor FlgM n=1 Tax=Porphyrobacter sp. TH134 TaxID=2067450 RepID=UPI001F444752|nr:flagellar biosynthesis anti-sigma factor FlgM [Porphyrobacter sp. TH134]